MCCKIDLRTQSEAAHFLGKGEPNVLPHHLDDQETKATSLFERLMAAFKSQSKGAL